MVPNARPWPKRLLRALAQTGVIVTVTLVLDYLMLTTVFAEWKRSWKDAATAYTEAYMPAPWHHDLAPNQDSKRPWGKDLYRFRTDRYGFRTGDCAPGEADKSRPAIFAVGDSFTEGIGVAYEESFVGLMACDAAKQGKAVWNLGVMSFSPIIHYRKIEAAAEKLGFTPTAVYVFLDLSDIMDEAIVYRVGKGGNIEMTTSYHWFDTGQFLLGNFATFRVLYDLWLRLPFGAAAPYEHKRARWSFDRNLMQEWGRRGLELAGQNMDRIVALCREWRCRVTLVVYPWPDNVAAGERNSIQVTHWRQWAASRGVRFVDGFAPFFREPAATAVRKYFIQGDAHFTAQGHRLLFEELRSVGEF
jgi:hypothetical protein